MVSWLLAGRAGGERLLVTVNTLANQGKCYVRLPFSIWQADRYCSQT